MNFIYFPLKVIFYLKFLGLRVFENARSKLIFWNLKRNGNQIENGFHIKSGAEIIFGKSSFIKAGKNLTIAEGASLFIGANGILEIGDDVFLGRGMVIVANQKVTIASNVQVAHYTSIMDSNHVKPSERNGFAPSQFTSAPIHIGPNTWIGANAIILKGVKIGAHATIGAGSVVTREVLPGKTVMGNPAISKN